MKDTMLSIKRYGGFKIKSALSNTIHVIALFGVRLALGEFQCKTYFKAQQHERRMIRNISRSVVSATVIILSNIFL